MDELEVLEQRARAGEWLNIAEAALLLECDRKTIDRMIKSGKLRYRVRPGSGYRLPHPEDVLSVLDASREVRHEQNR